MKRLCLAGVGLLVLGVIYSLVLRWRMEKGNRVVEVCIDWVDTQELLAGERLRNAGRAVETLSPGAFLERCKIMGVSSVALEEETLDDLMAGGGAIYFSDNEIEKLKAIGAVSGGILNTELLWVKKNSGLSGRIQNAAGPVKTAAKKIGDYIALASPEKSWENFRRLNVGPNPGQLEMLKNAGLKFVYVLNPSAGRIHSGPDTGMMAGWLFGKNSKETVSGWNESDDPAPGARSAMENGKNIFLFEADTRWFRSRAGDFFSQSERIVRAHTISPDEKIWLSSGHARNRWVRAVQERSCRFLYFRWDRESGVERNLTFLRSILQELKSAGYTLQNVPAAPVVLDPVTVRPLENLFRAARMIAAFCAAVLGPLIAVWFAKVTLNRLPHFSAFHLLKVWLGAVSITLFSALTIPAMLPDWVFVNGLEVFRGVKLALLLPLVLSGFILYSPAEAREFCGRKISVFDLCALGLVFLAIRVMLARSGNFGLQPHGSELELRSWLEQALVVRPRFKEFLLGHPALILGIHFWLRRNGDRESRIPQFLPALFFWIGTLGLVSIVNSFCHLHTPLSVSLLRTFHGVWLGGIVGLVMLFSFHIFLRPRPAAGSSV